MKEYKATVFDKEKYSLGESPFYDERFNRYSWVDITEGRLWTLKGGRKECFELGQASMGTSMAVCLHAV